MDLDTLVNELRIAHGDNAQVEAKAAARGFPDSVIETLSAFANTPGGGDVIFGLDEADGFSPVTVYDIQLCQQAVANAARHALTPPVALTTEVKDFEGHTLVIAHIPEADRVLKPVKVRKSGLAYLRQHDGDYPISEQEEQAFIADRGQPTFDEQPVALASKDDLDPVAVQRYVSERQLISPALARMSDDEVLLRTGVIAEGHPTIAGLLALGVYPQQFVANLGIQASLLPTRGASADIRAFDTASITGPIPTMLEEATAWVHRVAGRVIVGNRITGDVTNEPVFPALAVRELVANALIHRDLGPHALNQPITLQIQAGQLLISNPGGLFGLRLAALGTTPSHLRNGRLAEMCQYVTTKDRVRVVERLGTGIPVIRQCLAEAGMNPPVFLDQGVRFVAMVTSGPTCEPHQPQTQRQPVKTKQKVRDALAANGPSTTARIRTITGLTTRQISHALRQLNESGHISVTAFNGRSNQYMLTPTP